MRERVEQGNNIFYVREVVKPYENVLGMSIVQAELGKWLTKEEMRVEIGKKERLVGDPRILDSTGFDGSRWMEPMRTSLEVADLQKDILVAMAKKLMVQQGKVDGIWVAITRPATYDLLEQVRKELGFEGEVHGVVAACNSAALAFAESLRREGKQMLLGMDMITHLRDPMRWERLTPQKDGAGIIETSGCSDWSAMSFFSDDALGMVYDPSWLQVLGEVRVVQPDEKGVLTAIDTLDKKGQYMDWGQGIVRKHEGFLVVDMPAPPEGQAMYMEPMATAKFFMRMAKKMYEGLVHDLANKDLSLEGVNHFEVHHPSYELHRYIREKLFGVSEKQMPWNSHYGNSPASIFLKEWARILPEIQQGEQMVIFNFGAGATGVAMVVEVR